MQFRLMTYNIHKGIGGLDRRYRPERIVRTIAHYNPDVVFLQEVDDGVSRSNHHRQVDVIGEALGMPHRAFQRNVQVGSGHYGNAMLSRYPLSRVHHVDLTVSWKKRRQALVAQCQLPWPSMPPLLLYNVHLGLAGIERNIQLRRILGSRAMENANRDASVIAAGDFNDLWGRQGARLLGPAAFRCANAAERLPIKTFPAFLPMRPLDRIFVRGGLQVLDCFSSQLAVARHASDHLPMIADFGI